MELTPAQCRAGRALLNWSQERLEEAAKVAKKTIADFEREARRPYDRTLSAIRFALEAAGVEFTNGDAPGVRLRRKSEGAANQGAPEADDSLPEPLDPAVKG